MKLTRFARADYENNYPHEPAPEHETLADTSSCGFGQGADLVTFYISGNEHGYYLAMTADEAMSISRSLRRMAQRAAKASES